MMSSCRPVWSRPFAAPRWLRAGAVVAPFALVLGVASVASAQTPPPDGADQPSVDPAGATDSTAAEASVEADGEGTQPDAQTPQADSAEPGGEAMADGAAADGAAANGAAANGAGDADAAPAANEEDTTQGVQPRTMGPERLQRDEMYAAGYVPGYRQHVSLGASPYAPRQGSLAGGLTPGFGAPLVTDEWTFKWAGYMTASLQYSIDTRRYPADGQHTTVFHVTPQTVETYGYFTSTSTVPGNWVGMRFSYGNSRVSTTVSFDTWNPTRPTTYYQMGSQYFINNAYAEYTPRNIGPLQLGFRAGRFSLAYGTLAKYGPGMYVNRISGTLEGVGELLTAKVRLNRVVSVDVEHGFMGTRDGTLPDEIIPSSETSWRRPSWPGAWIHHAHLGFTFDTNPQIRVVGHYINNFSREDRNEAYIDNPGTRQVDESNIKDGRLSVYGMDIRFIHDSFGYLAAGMAHIDGKDAYILKGLETYGGVGEHITDRWWGVTSGGTGQLTVWAVNYMFSVGKMVNYPDTFAGDGPDIEVNTGLHVTHTRTPFQPYDGRVRLKGGLDVLYKFHRYVGIGTRFDHVVPDTRDSGETYRVLAPRLVFKTDWNTHETIQLIYAKWFYGERTRNEGTGLRTPERLDDQMVALNFNMWW